MREFFQSVRQFPHRWRRTSGLVTAVLACVVLSDLILQLNERASFTGAPTQFMMLHDTFSMLLETFSSIALILISARLFFSKPTVPKPPDDSLC